ncbi:sensor histidine kinase [Flavilitoribacter nigricans]|uniref:Signal transduction histidine kinase internal region domain-containing protein n=1 Tax=Flavilitoribacter nigricans (strain ATCC 23147 / DSM 23189 / NBRC 102662 / NCIMB 1420 / SS-2) TaxID=1122177 RepID=A0A2D0N238_FLAN2|nr:sensor histidine kinase [Flavilitoribacter nigricans]PHN02189.1 hypothetical protein CRP01_33175 [Flavilitoribacter nigricans DSM 23189 = NBRC 102662]
MQYKFIGVIILVLGGYYAKAQPTVDLQFNFKNIRPEDGLRDNRFNTYIFQDSKGFIWISSLSGLYRFDGMETKLYNYEDGLDDTNIQSELFEDRRGDIWFSTFSTLNVYVRQLDSILNVPILDENGIAFAQGYRVFHLDQTNDRLWLKVGDRIFGLSTKDPGRYFALPQKTNGVQFSTISGESGGLETIVASPWWNGRGIDFFQLQDTQLVDYKHYLHDHLYIKKSILLEDSSWLLMDDKKLFLFDETTPDTISILSNTISYKPWDAVKADGEHLYLSTLDKGLWYYNWKDDEFIKQWSTANPPPHNLSSDSPKELYLSPENYLWTSIRNVGIDYTYLHGNPFKNPLIQLELQDVEVVSVQEDQNKNVWVGIKEEGIKVFSGEGEFLSDYQIDLTESELWQVGIGGNGNIFAVSSRRLYYLDKATNSFDSILNPKGLTFRFLSSIYPKRTIVSTNLGWQELVINGKGQYSLAPCKEFINNQEFAFLQTFQTANRKVYIPYSASELWIYEATMLGLKPVKKVSCNLEFFGFCESKKYAETVWAASSKGLVRIVQDTLIQYEFGEDSELSNSSIYGIVEDDTGALWISGNQGLWQYQPKDSTLCRYETVDGISSNLFSLYYSAIESSTKDIWLANNKGLTTFDPISIEPLPLKPKVYIDQLTINNNKAIRGIGELHKIELKHDESTLTFLVKAIDYLKANQVKLHYRLKGYEERDEWLTVMNGQQIRYTKIRPGDFIFQVRAEDSFGNISEVHQLPIHIEPPWWETWIFYLLTTIIIVSITYLAYRLRINQVKKNAEKETAIAKLELQVAELETKAFRSQMNPHFLSNALNSIKGIVLKNETEDAAGYITKFSTLIRTILNNSEKKLVPLSKELEALKLYIELESLRFTNKFDYQIQVGKNVDQDFVRIPPLILQPFVENAIWHGLLPKNDDLKKLKVNIFRKDDFIICEIEDNGVGRKITEEKEKEGHESMGIDITKKRLQLLNTLNELYIIDLENDERMALGTKVIIQLYTPE